MLFKFLFILFGIATAHASDYPLSCSKLNFIYENSLCCDQANDAVCVQSIPHLEYTADVASLETKMQEIGVCAAGSTTCLQDMPSVVELKNSMQNISGSGLAIAIELAKDSQPKSDILTSLSNGIIPDGLAVEAGASLTIEAGATFALNGSMHLESLVAGATEEKKVILTHAVIDNIAGPVDFNNHELKNLNIADGQFFINNTAVTIDAASLNALSGLSSAITGDQLSYLDLASSEPGTSEPNKVVTADAQGDVTLAQDLYVTNDLFLSSGQLIINNTAITVSADEINSLAGVSGVTGDDFNALAGVSSHLGESRANKVLTTDANNDVVVSGTVTMSDLKVTQLYIDNVPIDASAADLNKLHNLSTTKAELELLSGLNVDVTTLNALDGMSASAQDLSLMEGLAADRNNSIGNRAVVLKDDGTLSLPTTVTVDTLDVTSLSIGGETLTATISDLNVATGLSSTITAENMRLLQNLTASAEELNVLSGIDSSLTTADLETVAGLATDKSNSVPGKAIVLDTDGTLHMHHDVRVTGTLNVDSLSINDTLVNVTALELNVLDGLESSVSQLNSLSEVTLNPLEFSRAVNMLSGIGDASAADFNMLQGVDADRTNSIADRVVVTKADGTVELPELSAGSLDVTGTMKIAGVTVDSTAEELNLLHNVAGLVKADFVKLAAIEATAAQVNTISDLTVDVNDLNLLSGLSAIGSNNNESSHLAVLDDSGNLNLANDLTANKVTATTYVIGGETLTADIAVLNQFTGINATLVAADVDKLIGLPTADELNVLSGINVNLTTADIDLLAGMAGSQGQSVASRALVADANNDITINGDVTVTGNVEAATLTLNGTTVTASAAEINTISTLQPISVSKINEFNSIDASAAQLNKFETVTTTAAELDALSSFTVDAAQVNSINSLTASASDLALLDNLENFIALDTNNNVDVVDLEVTGDFKVGSTTVSGDDIGKCATFFESAAACSGSKYHMLIDSDDSEIYLCKPDNSAVKIS